MRGPEFDVPIQPCHVPQLPSYLPQVRRRSALRGYLSEPIYAVRAKEVVGQRANVLAARELRDTIGLAPQQQLILLLFDSDLVLERLWNEAIHLLPEVAMAEYDAVVAPSYSIWLPRPRTEFLYNAKRSLILFQVLQQMKIPVVPRVAWVIEHDVHRWAKWASDPAVEVIALDLMTFRSLDDWRRQVDGLAMFDRLTVGASATSSMAQRPWIDVPMSTPLSRQRGFQSPTRRLQHRSTTRPHSRDNLRCLSTTPMPPAGKWRRVAPRNGRR